MASATRRKSAWWRDLIKDHPAILLTLGGVLLYGAVKYAYFLFYTRLGVDPDDLGLGYQQLLSRAALVFFAVLTGVALVTLVAVLVGGFIPARRRPPLGSIALHTAGIAGGVGVLLAIVALPVFAARYALWVRDGYPISANLCNISGLRAQHALVRPLGSGPNLLSNRDALMYLSQNDGDVVFYDYDADAIVRVPKGDFAIVLPREPHRVRSRRIERLLRCTA